MTDTFKAQIKLNASIMQVLSLGFYRNESTGVSLSFKGSYKLQGTTTR